MDEITLKPIPGCSGYFVRSDGTIWSAMPGCGGRYKSLHPLRCHRDPDGYLQVSLRGEGKRKRYSVHGLVALVFSGPRPDGMVTCHLNGVKEDNRPENLQYATQAENVRQGMEGGRMARGERSHLAKLTDAQASHIKRRIQSGESQASLAREYGVGVSTIWGLKTGRTWRHLPEVVAKSA